MARPRKPDDEKRQNISVRLEPGLLEELNRAIEMHNRVIMEWEEDKLTRNAFIEQAVERHLKSIL